MTKSLPLVSCICVTRGRVAKLKRVDDPAGRRVIQAAEAGQVVLPEHVYRVLKAWEAHPYGF